MTEDWTKWESLVINGIYPLRRFLTRSDHSVVFLTEYTKGKVTDAAIKLIPAVPASSEAQLTQWRATAALSHPHLIRLFDSGRCQLGGHPFLFVVMEYAEQTLAQILPHRALTLDEVREMLPPTIDALAFLHGRNLVHCRLKPPNLLVVNDQLKLASDGVRPADAKDGGVTPAGDIWALGATLVEALTQRPPDARADATSLPASLPWAFADTLRRCLRANPADRPVITDLDAQFKGAPPTPAVVPSAAAPPAPMAEPPPLTAEPPPLTAEPPPPTVAPATPAAAPPTIAIAPPPPVPAMVPPARPAVPPPPVTPPAAPPPPTVAPPAPPAVRPTPKVAPATATGALAPPVIPVARIAARAMTLPRKRLLVPAIAAALVLLTVAWAGSRLFHNRPQSPPPSVNTAPSAAQQAASAAAGSSAMPGSPAAAAQNAAAAPAAVVHEELPEVSRHARTSVRGTIKVIVRVTVDRSGKVIAQSLVVRGSSRYFARVAGEAAKKWRFAPDSQETRQWQLQFEFTRDGTTAHASPRT